MMPEQNKRCRFFILLAIAIMVMELKCTKYLHCDPYKQVSYSRDGDLEFIQCTSCGLIWRSPESVYMTKTYEEDYFYSKNYLKNRRHKIIKSGWFIDMALNINPSAGSLLEVGCSVGNTLEAARDRNLQHLGTDVSRYAVEYCRSCGLNAETKSLDELLADSLKFDIVYMQHVLEHFEDPFETLEKCHRLLNPEGILIIIVPNSDYRNAGQGRSRHRFYNQKGVGSEHFVYFNYASVESVLAWAGFRVMQKNYPILVTGSYSPSFLLNRLFRRSLSWVNADQEIIVIAQKA